MSLTAGGVQSIHPPIAIIENNKPTGRSHEVWTQSDPLEDNPAHALVLSNPQAEGSRFRKLREALAKISQPILESCDGWTEDLAS